VILVNVGDSAFEFPLDNESKRRVTFGKYKGKRLCDIMCINPQYLLWANDNVEFFSLSQQEEEFAIEWASELRRDEDEEVGGYYYDEFWKA
jgi:hypothetical protein